MLKFLHPDLYLDTINDINFRELYNKGIRALIFDIDNTLVPFDVPHPTEEIYMFFQNLKDMGFQICLLSNNREGRVIKFNENLKVYAVHKAGKPGKRGVLRALSLMGTDADNTVLIGDQIFTDIWCAKRIKLFSILVKPVSDRDEFAVSIKRKFEGFVTRSIPKNDKM